MNFDNQKFRASSLSKIMTNGRVKDSMSKTCESYLKEVLLFEKYGIQKDIKSKYLDKGIMQENVAIQMLSTVDEDMYTKNDEWFENDYMTGTPDIVEDKIIDIKCSWNAFTFANANPKDYYWQMFAYMWLTGVHKAEIAYCLVDTPDKLILDEQKRLAWDWHTIDYENDPEYQEACEEIETSMTFGQIPLPERVKKFEIERNEDDIKKVKNRINECREWLNLNK